MPETGGVGWEELQLNYLINLICAIYVSSILDFQMTLIDVRQSNVLCGASFFKIIAQWIMHT